MLAPIFFSKSIRRSPPEGRSPLNKSNVSAFDVVDIIDSVASIRVDDSSSSILVGINVVFDLKIGYSVSKSQNHIETKNRSIYYLQNRLSYMEYPP